MTLEKTLKQVQKKKFWQDKKILFSAGLSLLLNLAIWLIIIFRFKGTDQSVILHFSIFQKAGLIGPWIKLLNYPLFGLVIFIINLFLIFYFYLLRKKNLVWLLISALVLVQVFCLIAVWLIISIN
jgi:hypothetical protein